MNLWQDVVKAAVVGTERQAWKLNPADNQLGELLSRLNSADVEGSLLGAVGAIALYQRAGKLPLTHKQQQPEPCELNDLPCCSLRAGQHLGLMLHKQHAEVIPEWLALAAEAGKRVPPAYLPELLTLGQRQSNFREAILPVLGKRGHWLAAQNPDWNYVVSEDEEETWQTGSREARRLLLKRLREKDPDPARELLKKTWKKESADERAALLAILATSLSMNDEPFLEAALDDKRKQVRDVAAKLLYQLPESGLCQRMTERVRPLLTFSDNTVQVSLPNTCDQQMTRDGIDESRYSPVLGEKASWLLQMLACVPPSFWCNSWGKTPQQLVQAIEGNDWEKLLLEAWASAAINTQDMAWAEALLTVTGRFYQGYLVNTNHLVEKLLKVLSVERAQAFILQTLLRSQGKDFNSQHPAFVLLTHCRYPWSVEVSKVVLSMIRRYLEANYEQTDWSLRSALKDFACYMEPSIVYEAVSLPSVLNDGSSYKEAVDQFLATLLFRVDMIQALGGE